MGTHPSGASTIAEGPSAGEELLGLIRDQPEILGNACARFGADLPFLLKVLSVRTALSIQSHPDKVLAQQLHAERPGVYKDGNHKPEMAIALSDFEALCGFCPHEELTAALQGVPELRECCGNAACEMYLSSPPSARREALKAAFTALMTADTALVQRCIDSMVKRLHEARMTRSLSAKEQLVLRLNDQYPGDVGVLAAWFLNAVTLQAGEAIALAANEPHAYVSGEIIECMATSDNVIRAGLTPKLRDTDVLCASLSYTQGMPAVMRGEARLQQYLTLYRPPFEEFEVWRFAPPDGAKVSFPAAPGPMVMLLQHGSGLLEERELGTTQSVRRGHVLFVPAGTALTVTAEEGLVAWFAAVNSMGL